VTWDNENFQSNARRACEKPKLSIKCRDNNYCECSSKRRWYGNKYRLRKEKDRLTKCFVLQEKMSLFKKLSKERKMCQTSSTSSCTMQEETTQTLNQFFK
jgi:hypothetical protein